MPGPVLGTRGIENTTDQVLAPTHILSGKGTCYQDSHEAGAAMLFFLISVDLCLCANRDLFYFN